MPPTYRDLPDTMVDVPDDPDGVRIAVRVVGPEDGLPLLLVHGLSAQMVRWPVAFVHGLADAGLRVALLDNRDVGASTHLDHRPPARLPEILAGNRSTVAYGLEAMAGDAVAVLDALGWADAHVAGQSMGGMIVQRLAIDAPGRVRSLTSLMSTPHARIGVGSREAVKAMMEVPRDPSREAHRAYWQRFYGIVGSSTHPEGEDRVATWADLEFDRGFDRHGSGRQFAAITVAPDRTEALGGLDVPALVVHGAEDTLITPAGGEATAAAIPGARWELVQGMGHDLPAELNDRLVAMVVDHVRAAEG